MRRRFAWGLAAVDLLAVLVAALVDPQPAFGVSAMFLLGIGAYVGIGAFLIGRVPGNPIGALMLATGTVGAVTIVVGMYAKLGAAQVPPWPNVDFAGHLSDSMVIYPILIALVGIPLVFPDGHLPSPRYRWVVLLLITGMVSWMLGSFGISVDLIVLVCMPTAFIGAVAAIVIRFRRGDPIQRQQVKWLAAVVSVGAIAVLVGLFLYNSYPDVATALTILGVLSLFALPFVIATAILRYRLYEIDRIISRTLAYAAVTGILLVAYGAIVLLLSTVLADIAQGPTIAVAASTLAVLSLFQPVLRRVRRAVDRRFDRAAYDAERLVASFSERLRWQTEMRLVTTDLARTTHEAVAPATLTIWLRGSGSGR